MGLKAHVLAPKHISKAAHATAYHLPPATQVASFVNKMTAAFWTGGGSRATEIVQAVLTKGHQTCMA